MNRGDEVWVDWEKADTPLSGARLVGGEEFGKFIEQHNGGDYIKIEFDVRGSSTWWVSEDSVHPSSEGRKCHVCKSPKVYHDRKEEWFCPFCDSS